MIASRQLYYGATTLLAFLVLLHLGIVRGQDYNWDQLNYHIALPHLLLNGDFWTSVAPTGYQSFLNPVALIPQYLAVAYLPAKVAVLVLVTLESLAFAAAARLCVLATRYAFGGDRYFAAFLGFLICLLSPLALSEAGTTLFDLLVGFPVVGGYALMLRARDPAEARRGRLAFLAGLAVGAAVGLKFTSAPFAIGAFGFLVAGTDGFVGRLRQGALLGLGSALGFLVVGGPWAAFLWVTYGSPVFPVLNHLFHAPGYGFSTFQDGRWLAQSGWQAFSLPWDWLIGRSPDAMRPATTNDVPFRDARFIILLPMLAVWFVAAGARGRAFAARVLARPSSGLVAAGLVSYVIWFDVFTAQRYVIPLELMLGAVALAVVGWLGWRLVQVACLAVMVLASAGTIEIADWGRVAWGTRWQTMVASPVVLEAPTVVLVTTPPSSFVAAALPPGIRYVGLFGGIEVLPDQDNPLARRFRSIIAETGVHLRALVGGPVPEEAIRLIAANRMRITDRCVPFRAGVGDYRLCDVENVAPGR